MARRKLNHSGVLTRRGRALVFGWAILGILMPCGDASGQPVPAEPLQWKQSIERPLRDWDYDGKRILGTMGYDICLWDAGTGALLHRMAGHKEPIRIVQFSPDGEHALSSSWRSDGSMQPYVSKDTRTILWNLATGAKVRDFPGQVAGEFSPDGKRIVTFFQRLGTAVPDGRGSVAKDRFTGEDVEFGSPSEFDAAVWETSTGRQLSKSNLNPYSRPDSDTLHFSPDGLSFAYVDDGAFLPYNSGGGVLFNAGDGREIGRIDGEGVKFGRYGRRYIRDGSLAIVDREKVRLLDFRTGQDSRSVKHDIDLESIWGGAWTHDGSKVVLIPRRSGELRILDTESKVMTTGATIPPQGPWRAIVSPDNSRLAIGWSGGDSGKGAAESVISLYDLSTGREITLIRVTGRGSLIGFSPDSKTLLVGGQADIKFLPDNGKKINLPEFLIYNADNGQRIRALNLQLEAKADNKGAVEQDKIPDKE